MPSELETSGGSWQRLHPASLFFSLGSMARGMLLPGLLVLFASRGSGYEIVLMLLFIPSAIGSIVRYLNYRYRFGREELIIREGVVSRNERHIPWTRIQNIDQVQNPLHRLFSVTEVRLETAGGGQPEAVIRVLSLAAVEELRSQVFAAKRQAGEAPAGVEEPVAAPEEEGILLQLAPRELALFGLISSRGMTVVAAILGLLWQADLFDWRDERIDVFSRRLVQLREQTPLPDSLLTVVLAVAGVGVILVALRLLAAAWYMVKFHGFTLRRRDDDMRTEYGLLTRVSATIPQHRIQLLSTWAGPLHRLCRRAVVQIETAGGAEPGEGAPVNRQWLAPLVPEEQRAELIRRVLPEVDLDRVAWLPVAARARRRVLRRSLLLLALVTTVALAASGWWGLSTVGIGLPLALLHARLFIACTGYAVTAQAILFRSGWWTRRTSAVRFHKIQTLSLHESPFDRRNRMASVFVDTAGAGRVGPRIHIPYLDAGVARELLDRLSVEADRTAFQW